MNVQLVVTLLGFGATALPLSAVTGQEPTRAAAFSRVSQTVPSDSVLRDYFKGLKFIMDSAHTDERPLLWVRGGTTRIGPSATIQPEAGSHLLSDTALGRGRVVARILNNTSIEHRRLGLAPHSVTYWWVQRAESEKSGLAAVMITTDAKTGAILGRAPLKLFFQPHARLFLSEAVARWLYVPAKGDECWIPDPRGGCSVCDTTASWATWREP